MMMRCYNPISKGDKATYAGVSVCDEWLTFSNFKSWMKTQDWEGKQLDKDLMQEGNKVYGPDSCMFVSASVNVFITGDRVSAAGLPRGVTRILKNGRYRAKCRGLTGKHQVSLGCYSTPEEAHAAYWHYKCQVAKELAALQTDRVVADKLLERYKE